MTKEVFVFVVCGSKEHIDTLHFSLEYLKKYSKKTIIIITDSNRNEVDVLHDTLVDINTPAHFNHHQASIYLKTGIHQFLPKGHLYCYLDTDVVALNSECDDIFGQYQFPITFAPDHCKVRSFSSYAVNCGCQDRCAEDRENFKKSLNNYNKNDKLSSSIAIKQRRKIEEKYNQIQQSFLAKFFYAIKYYLSFPKFWLDKNLYFDKNKRYWATKDGVVVKYELDVKSMSQKLPTSSAVSKENIKLSRNFVSSLERGAGLMTKNGDSYLAVDTYILANLDSEPFSTILSKYINVNNHGIQDGIRTERTLFYRFQQQQQQSIRRYQNRAQRDEK